MTDFTAYCRMSCFDDVDADFAQQLGYGRLDVGIKINARRLLAFMQGGIEYDNPCRQTMPDRSWIYRLLLLKKFTLCYIKQMVSISDAVKKVVLQTPFLEEGLAAGMINLSALARILRPQIESKLIKNASDGALIMALKRLADKLQKKLPRQKEITKYISDITVRSHISEFTFHLSDTILPKQIKLLQEMRAHHDRFVTFTSGVVEVTVIVSSDLEKQVGKIFSGEKLLSTYNRLSAVILRLTPQTVATSGIYYLILKMLSWENINVVEIVSTYTEFILLLDDDKIDRAFSLLKSLLLPR